MRQLLLLIALVAGLLCPATGAVATDAPAEDPGQAGVGIRLVDAPVATRDDPRARIYIIDHVAPGTVLQRRVEVSNDSGAAAQVEVYAAGATIRSGAFIGLEGSTQNEASSWAELDQKRLRLADGESAMVEVTIRVPADAAPGEQFAVLWAQTSSGATTPGSVTQISRVGIRVYLSVGPGGEPAPDFEIESLTPARDASGVPVVQATIRNTGGRALDLSGSLSLSGGPGGLAAGPFPVTLGTTLAVGGTQPITVELDEQLPAGPWRAKVKVSSGLLTDSAEATISFPEAGTGEEVAADSTTALWWWITGVATVLLLLLLVAWWVTRRRRTRRRTYSGAHLGVA